MSAIPSAVIVLAAGDGTRMKSSRAKVLHRIGGRTLIGHALRAAAQTEATHVAVTVRAHRDDVAAEVTQVWPDAIIADQDDIDGTGRATECALAALPDDLEGTVLVTTGDTPLLTTDALLALTERHERERNAVTVLTAHVDDPTGYGRVLRDSAGVVRGIIEHKDALRAFDEGTEFRDALNITEINSAIYAFDATVLRQCLGRLTTDNVQGERYLTDVVALAREAGGRVAAHIVDDSWQIQGVNDKAQLARLGKELNARTLRRLMVEDGVVVIDPATTWVDVEVTVGRDTVLQPGTQLVGATTIGADCTIGPDTTLKDTEVADGARVVRTQAELAVIGPDATVGPFSYLRPGTSLGTGGKIGGFVETKNAQIGDGSKVPHLSYCGDATLGPGVNIGAGTIFANYDGVTKHHSNVGAHAFVGSNSVIVAPRSIADGAYIGAGSAIVKDVGPGQLAVTRAQQRNLDGWVARRFPGSAAHQAALDAEAQTAPRTDDKDEKDFR